ncbi:MAG: hypothetical protein OEM40_04120, partial [Acidimicrobiia bacterium]|nr:hypothetical protein [Acidimicrobiia bacterium]
MSVSTINTGGVDAVGKQRRTVALLVALVTALASLGALAAPADAAKKNDPPGQLVQIQLLAFNDYHG